MIKYILAVSIILMSSVAFGATDVKWTWDEITENADGTPCTDLSHYEVYISRVSDGQDRDASPTAVVKSGSVGFTDTLADNEGSYIKIIGVDTSGNRGVFSDEGSHIAGDTNPPGAGGGFQKQITIY